MNKTQMIQLIAAAVIVLYGIVVTGINKYKQAATNYIAGSPLTKHLWLLRFHARRRKHQRIVDRWRKRG